MTYFIKEEAEAICHSIFSPGIDLPDEIREQTKVLYGRLRHSVIEKLFYKDPDVDIVEAGLKAVYKLLGKGKRKWESDLGKVGMDLPFAYYLEKLEVDEANLPKEFYTGYFLLAMSEIVDFEILVGEAEDIQDLLDATTVLMGAQMSVDLGYRAFQHSNDSIMTDRFMFILENFGTGIKAEYARKEGKKTNHQRP